MFFFQFPHKHTHSVSEYHVPRLWSLTFFIWTRCFYSPDNNWKQPTGELEGRKSWVSTGYFLHGLIRKLKLRSKKFKLFFISQPVWHLEYVSKAAKVKYKVLKFLPKFVGWELFITFLLWSWLGFLFQLRTIKSIFRFHRKNYSSSQTLILFYEFPSFHCTLGP